MRAGSRNVFLRSEVIRQPDRIPDFPRHHDHPDRHRKNEDTRDDPADRNRRAHKTNHRQRNQCDPNAARGQQKEKCFGWLRRRDQQQLNIKVRGNHQDPKLTRSRRTIIPAPFSKMGPCGILRISRFAQACLGRRSGHRLLLLPARCRGSNPPRRPPPCGAR